MARKTDPVARLKRELADLDGEIAGLETQAADAERAVADARRSMRTANLDEGLAVLRQQREATVDLAEVLDAKRDLRRAKADELADAEAQAAVDRLRELRAERAAAIQETADAAKALRQALDRLGHARKAVKQQLGGLVEVQYLSLLAEADPDRLMDWCSRAEAGFHFRVSADQLAPDAWAEKYTTPDDHAASQAGFDQFKRAYAERARARLHASSSDKAGDSEAAA